MKKLISILLSAVLAISTFAITTPVNANAAQDVTLLYGDVNLDGRIALSDVVVLNRFLVRGEELSATALANANVCIDDVVNSEDSLLILKFIIGLENQLPIQYELPTTTTTEATTTTTEVTTTAEATTTEVATTTTEVTTTAEATTTTEVTTTTEAATTTEVTTTSEFVPLVKEQQVDDDIYYSGDEVVNRLDMSELDSTYDLYTILEQTELIGYSRLRDDQYVSLKQLGTTTYYEVSFVDCAKHSDTCNDTLICTYSTDEGDIKIYRCTSDDCYHITFFK